MFQARSVFRLAALGAAVAVVSACAPMMGQRGEQHAAHHAAHHGGQGAAMPAGMAGMAGMASGASASQRVTLSAQLNGAQEVPPVPGGGSGSAQATFNKETRELRYTVSYSGLSGPATGAHIHGPAAAGANAGVVVPFANPNSPISGTVTLNPTQAGDLQAGLYYVNVHTAAHPGGEIRGQLRLQP